MHSSTRPRGEPDLTNPYEAKQVEYIQAFRLKGAMHSPRLPTAAGTWESNFKMIIPYQLRSWGRDPNLSWARPVWRLGKS